MKASDRAYEDIRRLILGGEATAGSRLKEEELASTIGVSRTPIREALRRLNAEGLVEFASNHGTFVASWSDEDLEEIFSLRSLLEGFGAQLAASRITADQLARLDELANEMIEVAAYGRDFDQIAELNNRFHQLIIESAGNRRLTLMIRHIIAVPLVYQTFHRYTPDDLERSLSHHHELVAALRAGDGQWASSVMRSHTLAARSVLRRRWGDAASVPPSGTAVTAS